jgi:hypothetical protein
MCTLLPIQIEKMRKERAVVEAEHRRRRRQQQQQQ